MREIGDIVRKFENAPAEAYALATLVRAQGSSYRRPGARMLIGRDGRTVGSLSGGCLEEEVVERALAAELAERPIRMDFDTRRRFGCNGSLEILVERADPEFLRELSRGYYARQPMLVGTSFARDAIHPGTRIHSLSVDSERDVFWQQINPPVQLLIVGDGPDSLAMHGFAHTLGWPVIEVSSATEFREAYDEWTAAIVKTHNYGRDCAALRALLPLGLRYIGLLGPRRRRNQLIGDLMDSGVEVGDRLFGPAGLALGGDAPEAIALAIVSEIEAVFCGGTGGSLRDRRDPIHAVAVAALA